MKGYGLILGAGALALGGYFLLRKPSTASAATIELQMGAAAASELQELHPNTQAAVRILLDPANNATQDAYTSAIAQLHTAGKTALVDRLVAIYQEKFPQ